MMIANATGCSSIYGGNLPTTPWAVNADGRGPAWSNSLFEDNAEFGLGMRLAVDKQPRYARELVTELARPDRRRPGRPASSRPSRPTRTGIAEQRERVAR
jgi:pyruvate-ferredoxin/flavodoxin oxidoreductase